MAALTGDNPGARSDTAYVGHNALAAPMDLSAMEASETKINLSWTAPNQGSGRVAYYQLERAYGDVMFLDAERTDNGAFMDAESWWDGLDCEGMVEAVMDDRAANMSNPFCKMYDNLADADETMVDEYFAKRYAIIEAPATAYMDTGLMAGTEYSYRLRSVHEVDGADPDMHESLSDWSMTVMATPAQMPPALTAPAMVDATVSGSMVTVTWTEGAGADKFTIAMFRRNADGSVDVANAVWQTGVTASPYTVDMESRPAGTYVVAVAAGQDDDSGGTTWSNWATDSVDYQP